MTSAVRLLNTIIIDVRIALSFSTILPLGPAHAIDGTRFTEASWASPVAGLVVGLIAAIVYAIAHALSLPAAPAAVLAVATTVLVTGALHEDGLADTADGLGGGRNRERKLEIMRDSRIGTYGTCALMLSLGLRCSALATLAQPWAVTTALLAAHAASRALVPAFMRVVASARTDGLSATAGRPPTRMAAIALGLGMCFLFLTLGAFNTVIAAILLALVGTIVGRLALRHIGGQTGDILGTVQQIAEITLLVLATVVLHPASAAITT